MRGFGTNGHSFATPAVTNSQEQPIAATVCEVLMGIHIPEDMRNRDISRIIAIEEYKLCLMVFRSDIAISNATARDHEILRRKEQFSEHDFILHSINLKLFIFVLNSVLHCPVTFYLHKFNAHKLIDSFEEQKP